MTELERQLNQYKDAMDTDKAFKDYQHRVAANKIWDICKESPEMGNAVMDLLGDEGYKNVMMSKSSDVRPESKFEVGDKVIIHNLIAFNATSHSGTIVQKMYLEESNTWAYRYSHLGKTVAFPVLEEYITKDCIF